MTPQTTTQCATSRHVTNDLPALHEPHGTEPDCTKLPTGQDATGRNCTNRLRFTGPRRLSPTRPHGTQHKTTHDLTRPDLTGQTTRRHKTGPNWTLDFTRLHETSQFSTRQDSRLDTASRHNTHDFA